MELFGKETTTKQSQLSNVITKNISFEVEDDIETIGETVYDESSYKLLNTFQKLGLVDWMCQSAKAIGYKRPTDIQRACIPAILAGRDVIGCAR